MTTSTKRPDGGELNSEIVRLIDELRRDEGDSVTFISDNPDFNGQPNCAIVCNGDWTGYEDRRFAADTILDALSSAATERKLPTARQVIAESNGHHWVQRFNLVCCRDCGIVRRADDKNSPCKGIVTVELRSPTNESPAPQPPVEGLREALEAAEQMLDWCVHEHYAPDNSQEKSALAKVRKVLRALASPPLTAEENTKSDGGVEGHALVTSKVALNEDADLSARRAESAPQASSVPAGIKPGPSDPLPTAPAPDVREAISPTRLQEIKRLAHVWAEIADDEEAAPTGSMLGVINELLAALSQQPVAVADQEAITPFSVVERTLVEFFSANDVQTEEDGGEWLAYLGIDEEEFSLTGLATAITSALLHPQPAKGER